MLMDSSSSNTDGRVIIIPVPTKTYDGGCPKKRNTMGTRNASDRHHIDAFSFYSIQENRMNRLFGSSNNHDNGIEWRPSSTSSKSASSNTIKTETTNPNPNPRAYSASEPARGGTHQAQGSAINSSAAVPSSAPRRTRLSFELHPSKLYLDDLGQITILQ